MEEDDVFEDAKEELPEQIDTYEDLRLEEPADKCAPEARRPQTTRVSGI